MEIPRLRRAPVGRRARLPRLSLIGLLALALVATACGGGSDDSSSTSSTTYVPTENPKTADPGAPENVAFYYLPIRDAAQMQKLGPVRLVVAGPQNADVETEAGRAESAAAAAAIHSTGAKAYVYQQTYWTPLRRAYQGFRIRSHEDWAYCLDGDTPLEVQGKNDEQWVFIDLNERAVQDYLAERFQNLKEQGWDGIFFDRGGIAMAGYAQNPQIWNKQSTCTQDPVRSGAANADTWVDASGLVKQSGLDLIVNYGLSPFDPRNPMRPDPHSEKCETQNPDCPILEDAWTNPTWVSDESIAHEKDTNWDVDYQANLQNEQNAKHGGQVLGLITLGTLGGDKSREAVFFAWARVKLFDIPLGVAVWDREKACPGVPSHEACDTLLTYPELTSVQLGKPIEARPDSSRCQAGTPPRCVWSRRYEEGAMVVNVQRRGIADYKLSLGTKGCRYVRDVASNQPLAGNQCVTEVTLDLLPWSGRPLAYSAQPIAP
jgi:hypothetical protein